MPRIAKWMSDISAAIARPSKSIERIEKLSDLAAERIEEASTKLSLLSDLSARNSSEMAAQIRSLSNEVEYLKRRIFESVNGTATPLFDTVLGKTTRAGIKMFIDGRDSGSGSNIITDAQIEPNITRLISKLVVPGGVFLDVGANFGYYSLLAAMLTGAEGRVIAFEANPYLVPLIKRAIYVNGFTQRVAVINKAVSDSPGKAPFGFAYESVGGGGLGTGLSTDPKINKVEVDLARIDDLVEANLVVDCIKIDVEGHEYAALKGAEALLRRSPNVSLIIEYFTGMQTETNKGLKIIDYLAELGFSVWKIGDLGFLEEITREQLENSGDIYILAARSKPRDREIILKRNSLQFAHHDSEVMTGKTGQWLVQGPYWPISAGTHEIFIDGDMSGTLELTATHEFGIPISSRHINSGAQSLIMSFPYDIRYFAVVLRAATDDASVRLDQIRIRDIS